MSTDLNVNQFHEELIRQQGKQISEIAVGSNSQPDALAPILLTPFLGDGKTSRQSGMNAIGTTIQRRLEARTDPKTSRSIGRNDAMKLAEAIKSATHNWQALLTDRRLHAPALLGSAALTYATVKAINDVENKKPWYREIHKPLTVGLAAGALSGAAHAIRGFPKPLGATAIYMTTLGLGTPALYYGAHQVDKLTKEKLMDRYAKDQLTGTTLPTQKIPAHINITEEVSGRHS
jgi:hypothetical protein